MSAYDVLEEVATAQEWDEGDRLDVALQYIENQGDNEGFREFLRYVVEEEKS